MKINACPKPACNLAHWNHDQQNKFATATTLSWYMSIGVRRLSHSAHRIPERAFFNFLEPSFLPDMLLILPGLKLTHKSFHFSGSRISPLYWVRFKAPSHRVIADYVQQKNCFFQSDISRLSSTQYRRLSKRRISRSPSFSFDWRQLWLKRLPAKSFCMFTAWHHHLMIR